MPEIVIHTTAPREAVLAVIRSLPQKVLAGGPLMDEALTKCGIALLDHIKEAFVVKSQGGTDEAGENWAPLSPKTIAYRRAKRSHTERSRATRPSQALDDRQRDRWWQVYRQNWHRFRGNKASAAKIAWTVLKSEGAHTLIDKYGTEKVDILRDTFDLINSLTPNSGSSLAVFRVTPATVEMGTTRVGALSHHKGDPSRNLPQRKLWPDVRQWPDTWWRDILKEIQDGIVRVVVQEVSNTH